MPIVYKILVVNRKVKTRHKKDNIEWSGEIIETLEVTDV
jgi:hypothetical protein